MVLWVGWWMRLSFDILTSYLNHLSPLQGYYLVIADWSISLQTRIIKCYLNYPIGQLSDFLLPLDPRQVPSLSEFFTGKAGRVNKKNYWPETIFTGHGPAGQC